MTDVASTAPAERALKPALFNGMRLKCPKCGRGRLLHSYLKVNEHCDTCQEDLRPQRADDGPAYLTILLVGHIMGFVLHFAYTAFRPEPLTLALVLSAVAVASTLFLLPRMKGLVVAYQWSKRMHGF
ncbi:DUF983 domain-containing protein [uncultured Tateyamaria sp.]|uniref:DUF983 domain-containing protein n=1 Tax=uncultured Tateyamaria sp. TaxID=455651 RepID=UPI0026286F7A|nr:DUF983 domain-containing protein [uncultured Tateyamaria sp.]